MLLLLALIAAAAPAPADATDGARVTAAHAGAVLLGMRMGAAVLWPSDYGLSSLRNGPSNLRAAWTRPPEFRSGRPLLESDGDPWPVNVFGHGVFGSEIYLRARQCGSGPAGAFAWAAGASVAWEYGLEATAKRPSAIDLAWTPVVGGLVFGELRFRLHRWLGEGDPGAIRRGLRTALDPLGALERALGAGC